MINFFKRLTVNFLYLLSFLSIRKKNIWVFGSYGNFNDNSRYIFLSMLEKKDIKSIWIAKNYHELNQVKKISKNCYYKYSFLGIFYCLIAKFYVYSAYVSDINYFTVGSAIKVNLWHGIPLKKIEFDITKGEIAHIFNGSLISRFFYPWVYIKPDLLLSPNEYVSEYSFEKAFRVSKENIIIHTYPRVINLIEMKLNYIKSNEKRFTFFYAPTWRDSNPNFINDLILNFDILEDFCIKNNAKILIKLHSNTKIKFDYSKYKFIEFLDNSIDSNEAMIISDCLITDYSSIYFDYLYLEKPIIFYRFDEFEYVNNSRELYHEMYRYVPGFIVKKFNDLVLSMSNVMADDSECIKCSEELRLKFKLEKNYSNCDLICQIKERVDR